MTDDDEDVSVSAEVADTSAESKIVQEGDVSDEVADTQAEMKMIELSQDPQQEDPPDLDE